MSGNGNLTSASASAIAEHLSSRLLGKSGLGAFVILAEELAYTQMNNRPIPKDGKVMDNPYITTMHLFAFLSAVRTGSFF
jgi:hypothetical protein